MPITKSNNAMIQKTPLNALKYFYYVAHYGSVTTASQTLNVTQGAVSKQVKNLEILLEFDLFDRVNNSLILTAKGQKLYQTCHSVFAQLDNCLIDLQEPTISNQLVLSCEPTISMRWIIPRLSEFKAFAQAKGYEFDVVLLTAGGAIDFQQTEADLALRRNDFAWSKHIYHEKISDEYIMMVKSTRHKNKRTLLVTTSRPKFMENIQKIGLSNDQLDNQLNQYNRMELEHFYLCIEGCLAGLGATVASIYMLEKEINYQMLEPISPAIADGSAYYLLSAEPFHKDKRKGIFKEWLQREMGRTRDTLLK